ncbi:hypothetical protein [Oleispirillum naphthae]|uniref:hypothetical protein n=1 Tax=Oleispirillum naphthae TaxID=2838853 RepID=UPI0030822FD5
MPDRAHLRSLLWEELARPVPDDVRAMAATIARRHGGGVAAVLFYGSRLRAPETAAMADLYVLVDGYRAFHGGRAAALANRVLPPTVRFLPAADGGAGFKAAVISLRQFRRRMRPDAIDTTLWARFCQPAALAYCRDAEARRQVVDALAAAAAAAVHWAARLCPETTTAEELWRTLFRRTYGAELRVEDAARADALYAAAAARYDALLPAVLTGDELVRSADGTFRRVLPAPAVAAARAAWRRRRGLGKALNLARLAKALFTFGGGIGYIVDKLERHSGRRIALTPWQRRHPLLAAPGVIADLLRRGIIR